MTQTVAAYVIFAAAAGWLVWRMAIPATVKARMLARMGKKGCDDDCGCSS